MTRAVVADYKISSVYGAPFTAMRASQTAINYDSKKNMSANNT